MRAVAMGLVGIAIYACGSKPDSRTESRASAPTVSAIRNELPPSKPWAEYTPLVIRATHLDRDEASPVIYAVPIAREAYDAVLAMATLTGTYTLASHETGAELPWVFGSDDKTVTERIELQVREGEIGAGDSVHIPYAQLHDQLGALISSARTRTALPLSASLAIEPQVSFVQFAELMDFLGQHGIRTVSITTLAIVHPSEAEPSARIPTISVGQPSVTGDLDKAIVRRYMKRNRQKMQYCYEKQLMTRPTVAGPMVLSFTIQPDGSVIDGRGTAPTPDIASCAVEVLKEIVFPAPKNNQPVMVVYPFTLARGTD